VAITSPDPDTTFSATGLPPGLSINTTTGVISGTIDPRGAGSYTVIVSGTDDGSVRGNVSFTWKVADTTPPGFTNPGTQNNNEGDTVNLAISSVDADAGSFSATGLPPGLSINPNTGVISGTIAPRGAGTYTVTVSASDGTVVGSVSFTWNVADTTPPGFTNPGTQNNNEGDKVNLAISSVDADAGSFSATGLPPGLSINPNTGVISGTIDPRAANKSPYTVTVSASDNGHSASINFTWNVADTTPPGFTNPGTQNNNEGDKVNLAISSVDADAGSFSATGLPPGLSINPNTGVISGTIDPRGTGVYTVTVSASDNGHSSSVSFTWMVADTTPPMFTNPGTQNNNEGNQVSLAINAVDADAGSFRATGLPPGLSINPNTGVISGTIFAPPGTYQVTVSASDGGSVGSVTFAWVINSMPSATVVTSIHNTYVGLVQLETVSALVTDPAGIPVNEGVVTFQVNGETLAAAVHNGFATVTFATPMLSFNLEILLDDFFPHLLDAVYSDPAGIFGPSGASATAPPMLIDFLFFLEAEELRQLAQFQIL